MKKLLMSLLLVSGGFVGLNGAEQMTDDEENSWFKIGRVEDLLNNSDDEQDEVPTLVSLCQKYIDNNLEKISKFKPMSCEARTSLNPLIRDVFNKIDQDIITKKVAKIALYEFQKKQNDTRVSPLKQFKETNPQLAELIDQGIVSYSLSIQDLINVGSVKIVQHKYDASLFLDFTNLDITSLDGLRDIKDISKLEELFFCNNQLKIINSNALKGLSSLKNLFFTNNKIKTIEKEAFSGLQALQTLNFSGNEIEHVDISLFVGIRNLKFLNLQFNSLSPELQVILSGSFLTDVLLV